MSAPPVQPAPIQQVPAAPKKAVLFIDGAYLLTGVTQAPASERPILNTHDGIAKLIDVLEVGVGETFSRMYFFNATYENNTNRQAEKSFHNALQANNIRVILKEMKFQDVYCQSRSCNCVHRNAPIKRFVQAGVDVAIATQMLTMVADNAVDTVVLLAGDGDFDQALQYISETKHHIRVWVIGYKRSMSNKLRGLASRHSVLYLEDLWHKLLFPVPSGFKEPTQTSPPNPADFPSKPRPNPLPDRRPSNPSSRRESPANSPSVNLSAADPRVAQIMGMGFPEDVSIRALQACNFNAELAINFLCDSDPSLSHAVSQPHSLPPASLPSRPPPPPEPVFRPPPQPSSQSSSARASELLPRPVYPPEVCTYPLPGPSSAGARSEDAFSLRSSTSSSSSSGVSASVDARPLDARPLDARPLDHPKSHKSTAASSTFSVSTCSSASSNSASSLIHSPFNSQRTSESSAPGTSLERRLEEYEAGGGLYIRKGTALSQPVEVDPQPDEADIEQLMTLLGRSRQQCIEALLACNNNVDRAADRLLSG